MNSRAYVVINTGVQARCCAPTTIRLLCVLARVYFFMWIAYWSKMIIILRRNGTCLGILFDLLKLKRQGFYLSIASNFGRIRGLGYIMYRICGWEITANFVRCAQSLICKLLSRYRVGRKLGLDLRLNVRYPARCSGCNLAGDGDDKGD